MICFTLVVVCDFKQQLINIDIKKQRNKEIWMYEWMNEWMIDWLNKWMNKKMNEWMNE